MRTRIIDYELLLSWPGCLLPCLETHINTVFIDEKSTEGTERDTSTRFDIAFSTTVRTFINDFPSFSFSSFLAATGGAIGRQTFLVWVMDRIISLTALSSCTGMSVWEGQGSGSVSGSSRFSTRYSWPAPDWSAVSRNKRHPFYFSLKRDRKITPRK